MQWCEVTANSEIFLTHRLWLWSQSDDCIMSQDTQNSQLQKSSPVVEKQLTDIVSKCTSV